MCTLHGNAKLIQERSIEYIRKESLKKIESIETKIAEIKGFLNEVDFKSLKKTDYSVFDEGAIFSDLVEYVCILGVTQRRLALSLGVSTGTVCRWAAKQSKPPRYARKNVSKELHRQLLLTLGELEAEKNQLSSEFG